MTKQLAESQARLKSALDELKLEQQGHTATRARVAEAATSTHYRALWQRAYLKVAVKNTEWRGADMRVAHDVLKAQLAHKEEQANEHARDFRVQLQAVTSSRRRSGDEWRRVIACASDGVCW